MHGLSLTEEEATRSLKDLEIKESQNILLVIYWKELILRKGVFCLFQ